MGVSLLVSLFFECKILVTAKAQVFVKRCSAFLSQEYKLCFNVQISAFHIFQIRKRGTFFSRLSDLEGD